MLTFNDYLLLEDVDKFLGLPKEKQDQLINYLIEMAINNPQAKAAEKLKDTYSKLSQRKTGFSKQCSAGNKNACIAADEIGLQLGKIKLQIDRNKLA